VAKPTANQGPRKTLEARSLQPFYMHPGEEKALMGKNLRRTVRTGEKNAKGQEIGKYDVSVADGVLVF